jgi:membrane fusion protein (multidrug efflux system)
MALAGLVGLVLVIAWMSGAFHEKTRPGHEEFEQQRVDDREVATVETLQTVQTVDAVGTVQPRRKSDVASRLLATINEIQVDPGDSVEQGQLLVVLDDREIQAQLRESEASMAGIEADLAVRRRERDRYRRMLQDNAVTQEDFDRIEGAFQVTQAQLDRTLAQVNRVKIMLTYTQIRAQTAGLVADRHLDPGDLAVPGKPIVSLYDPTQMELNTSVREGLADKVSIGMKMDLRIDAVQRTMVGTVREIVPRAEATSRSLLVKVTLPSDQLSGLFIGMFGRLSIPVKQLERIVVDARAIQRVGQLDIVDVVQEGDTLERRFVRLGERFGEQVEVLSGLAVSESVALPNNASDSAVVGADVGLTPAGSASVLR